MIMKLLKSSGILLALVFVQAILTTIPVYFLWNNALIGAVSGVNEITLVQSFGITMLTTLLFRTNITKK